MLGFAPISGAPISDVLAAIVAAAAAAAAEPRGGGFTYADIGGRQRTPADIRRDRQRFGIIPPDAVKVIEDVAARQAEDLRLDEQQRLEELAGELRLVGIEYQSTYLALLNQERQRRIEIIRRARVEEEETSVMLLLASV